jgi:hypothetical protein
MKILSSLAIGAAITLASGIASAQVVCFEPNFGPSIGVGDDVVLPAQPIGFAFPFNGATYTNVFACTNGFIYLSNAATTTNSPLCCTGTSASLVASPDPMIAPYWTDLLVTAPGSVNFTANAVRAVITWNNACEYPLTAPAWTTQLQLYASGEIVMFFGPTMVISSHTGLTGMSPGANAPVPPASNYSAAPFLVGNTNFQTYTNVAPPLIGSSLDFVPAGPNQYLVQILNCAASNLNYGAGCIQHYASFYENMTPASSFDLNNSSMTLLPAGGGYVALPGINPYHAPSPGATVLALGDDTTVSQALAGNFPFPGGSTNTLWVCSNGFVSMATGNTSTYIPNVATMLSAPQTGYYCWHDFNPTIAGSGTVKFEEIAGVAYVTWDGVWDYGSSSVANASTWQLQFDENSGAVTWVWQTMSPLGGTTATGFLVGYSPAGASADPGGTDIDVALPGSFTLSAADVLPVALAATPAPVLGNTVVFTTSNIPAATILTGHILSFGQIFPGVDLGFLGAPGCLQLINTAGSSSVLLFGSPTVSHSVTIPNVASFAGIIFFTQSASLTPGVNPLGLLTSNGVKSFINIF